MTDHRCDLLFPSSTQGSFTLACDMFGPRRVEAQGWTDPIMVRDVSLDDARAAIALAAEVGIAVTSAQRGSR